MSSFVGVNSTALRSCPPRPQPHLRDRLVSMARSRRGVASNSRATSGGTSTRASPPTSSMAATTGVIERFRSGRSPPSNGRVPGVPGSYSPEARRWCFEARMTSIVTIEASRSRTWLSAAPSCLGRNFEPLSFILRRCLGLRLTLSTAAPRCAGPSKRSTGVACPVRSAGTTTRHGAGRVSMDRAGAWTSTSSLLPSDRSRKRAPAV